MKPMPARCAQARSSTGMLSTAARACVALCAQQRVTLAQLRRAARCGSRGRARSARLRPAARGCRRAGRGGTPTPARSRCARRQHARMRRVDAHVGGPLPCSPCRRGSPASSHARSRSASAPSGSARATPTRAKPSSRPSCLTLARQRRRQSPLIDAGAHRVAAIGPARARRRRHAVRRTLGHRPLAARRAGSCRPAAAPAGRAPACPGVRQDVRPRVERAALALVAIEAPVQVHAPVARQDLARRLRDTAPRASPR